MRREKKRGVRASNKMGDQRSIIPPRLFSQGVIMRVAKRVVWKSPRNDGNDILASSERISARRGLSNIYRCGKEEKMFTVRRREGLKIGRTGNRCSRVGRGEGLWNHGRWGAHS